jgi:segregation and condensation protein B
MDVSGNIESILFVASKPLSAAAIARSLKAKEADVREAIEDLKARYNHAGSGIHILTIGDEVEMGTNPEHAAAIEGFVKDEIAGELTKAQLETLTVIAYRGPVTRPELEQIRGVNCALILRNLLLRGLIEEKEDDILPRFTVSFEALRHLGIRDVSELPEYESLHAHEHLEKAIGDMNLET